MSNGNPYWKEEHSRIFARAAELMIYFKFPPTPAEVYELEQTIKELKDLCSPVWEEIGWTNPYAEET